MLELTVFLCGAVVMVIELTGSRVVAPYLGTSLVVWTSLIGIILAALSLGYWWGGRLADRRPEARLLGRIILLAALATGAIAVTHTLVLGFLQSQAIGLSAAAVCATLLLFAPPAVLLGMVAPFAVRLKLADTASGGVRPAPSTPFRPSAASPAPSSPVSCSSPGSGARISCS
jgi:predicted membrane-bound spermidine synthase